MHWIGILKFRKFDYLKSRFLPSHVAVKFVGILTEKLFFHDVARIHMFLPRFWMIFDEFLTDVNKRNSRLFI